MKRRATSPALGRRGPAFSAEQIAQVLAGRKRHIDYGDLPEAPSDGAGVLAVEEEIRKAGHLEIHELRQLREESRGPKQLVADISLTIRQYSLRKE